MRCSWPRVTSQNRPKTRPLEEQYVGMCCPTLHSHHPDQQPRCLGLPEHTSNPKRNKRQLVRGGDCDRLRVAIRERLRTNKAPSFRSMGRYVS